MLIPKADNTREIYAYDYAGNLIKSMDGEGNTTAYRYNAAGLLSAVTDPLEQQETYAYDAEGLRCEMEENGRLVSFIFRGDEIIVEETKEDKIRYIRTHELLASDAQSARTYYHYASDEMGSITHVIEQNCILNRYAYDAWGVPMVCEERVKNRFRFNGRQYDPISQQYYLRARF